MGSEPSPAMLTTTQRNNGKDRTTDAAHKKWAQSPRRQRLQLDQTMERTEQQMKLIRNALRALSVNGYNNLPKQSKGPNNRCSSLDLVTERSPATLTTT